MHMHSFFALPLFCFRVTVTHVALSKHKQPQEVHSEPEYSSMKIPVAIVGNVRYSTTEICMYRFIILILTTVLVFLYFKRSFNYDLALVVSPSKSAKCPQQRQYVRPLKTRMELPYYFNELKFEIGAELGVQTGSYSKHILTHCQTCKTLYLVDVWMQSNNYKDLANVDDARQRRLLWYAKRNLAAFKDRTVFLRGRTDEVVKKIADSSLDFIYLDARHDYCAVAQDLHDWWPKIRPGGLLTGHDFIDDKEVAPIQDWTLCEDGRRESGAVKRAVEEFAAQHDLIISVMYREQVSNSFMIRKPPNQTNTTC